VTHTPVATQGQSIAQTVVPDAPLDESLGPASIAWGVVLTLWAVTAIWAVWSRRLWKPKSAPPDRSPIQPHVLFLIGALCWLGGQIVGATVAIATGAFDSEGLLNIALVSVLGQSTSVLIAAGAIAVRPELIPSATGLGLIGVKGTLRTGALAFAVIFPITLLIGAGAQQLGELVARITGEDAPDAIAHTTLRQMAEPSNASSIGWWIMLAVVVIGAPVSEEIIYRGFIQTALARMTRSHWFAILATTGLFAIVHLGAVTWYALLPLAVLSVMMGLAYARTGVLWVPIAVHALFNASNVVMAMIANA
jgi:membrane protease YdiL (CAAX protease family)